jgi:hypothetical protein
MLLHDRSMRVRMLVPTPNLWRLSQRLATQFMSTTTTTTTTTTAKKFNNRLVKPAIPATPARSSSAQPSNKASAATTPQLTNTTTVNPSKVPKRSQSALQPAETSKSSLAPLGTAQKSDLLKKLLVRNPEEIAAGNGANKITINHPPLQAKKARSLPSTTKSAKATAIKLKQVSTPKQPPSSLATSHSPSSSSSPPPPPPPSSPTASYSPPPSSSSSSPENSYSRLSPRDHVLLRPQMYRSRSTTLLPILPPALSLAQFLTRNLTLFSSQVPLLSFLMRSSHEDGKIRASHTFSCF